MRAKLNSDWLMRDMHLFVTGNGAENHPSVKLHIHRIHICKSDNKFTIKTV